MGKLPRKTVRIGPYRSKKNRNAKGAPWAYIVCKYCNCNNLKYHPILCPGHPKNPKYQKED